MSDRARTHNVRRCRVVCDGPRQFVGALSLLNQLGNVIWVTEFTTHKMTSKDSSSVDKNIGYGGAS